MQAKIDLINHIKLASKTADNLVDITKPVTKSGSTRAVDLLLPMLMIMNMAFQVYTNKILFDITGGRDDDA